MKTDLVAEALNAIKWQSNVDDFLKFEDMKNIFVAGNYKLAIWSRQIEQIDAGNPALSFVREMQLSGQQVVALNALALYKPAAASIRAALEAALYYLYFRTHAVELNTLHRVDSYWVSKSEIIDFLKLHSPRFAECQVKLGLITSLEESYKHLSSIVHGQKPGTWGHKSFKKIGTIEATALAVAESFEKCVEVINKLFFCTIAQENWDDFSPTSKGPLLKGMSGDLKAFLNLDFK